jgi:Tol biopolymer transport system component
LSCNEGGDEFRGGIADTKNMIAFVSTNDIFVVKADGTELTKVVQGSFPAWSPDGTRLAYISSDGGLWIVDLASGDRTQLTQPDTNTFEAHPWWSPDGERLAFQSASLGYDESDIMDVENVQVVNADGTNQAGLTHNETSFVTYQPWGWSPDGASILVYSDADACCDIYTLGPDTEVLTPLSRQSDDSVLYRRIDPAWSPGGSLIAFRGVDGGRQEIGIMNPDGTAERAVYELHRDSARPPESLFPTVSLPQWSPDGEVIAFVLEWFTDEFVVGVPTESTGEIYSVRRDGTGAKNLTNDPARDGPTLGHERRGFSWSPDGTRIVFVSNRDGTDDLYVMNADGSGVRQLTYGNSVECCGFGWLMDSPVWSPSK